MSDQSNIKIKQAKSIDKVFVAGESWFGYWNRNKVTIGALVSFEVDSIVEKQTLCTIKIVDTIAYVVGIE